MNTQESNGLTNLLDLIEAEKMEEAAAAWKTLAKAEAEQATVAIRVLLAIGQTQTAQAWLEAAKEDHSGWMEVSRCMLALAMGDMPAARKHGNLAISAGIEEALIFDIVGQAAESLAMYREALMFYLRAQQGQKSDERLLRILALLIRTGETETVEKTLARIEAEKPEIDVRAIRVLLACIKGDKAAIEESAAKLDAEDDTLLTAYAKLQAGLALGYDVSALLEVFREADATITDLWIADAYIRMNEMAKAEEMLDRVTAREPEANDGQHAFEMGRRYEMVGSLEKARAQFEKADTEGMPVKRALLTRLELAHCLIATGDKDKGMQMLSEINLAAMQALMQNPSETELYLVRLRCYVEMGKKQEARELADFMLRIAKDDEAREMIRSVVK